MDIAAQELDRVRGPFACGVTDKADRCDGTFGKQCNRRNHGAQAVECDAARTDPTAAP